MIIIFFKQVIIVLRRNMYIALVVQNWMVKLFFMIDSLFRELWLILSVKSANKIFG